jgi:hypothetical membrane protein
MSTSRFVRLAGALMLVAGAVILMGIITAEALYPAAYTTGGNEISDLGGTEPPEGLVLQPSATIFDLAMIVSGVLLLGAALGLQAGLGRMPVTLAVAAVGVGALGVGIFPGNTGGIHGLFAMLTFIGGGIAAIVTARVTQPPFRFLSALLGIIALATLGSYILLGDGSPLAGLGIGGIERWVAYPIVIWVIGFGGYLSAWTGRPSAGTGTPPPPGDLDSDHVVSTAR